MRGSSRGAATAANSATAAAAGDGEERGGGGAVGRWSAIPWRRRERGGQGSRWRARLGTGGSVSPAASSARRARVSGL